MEIPDKDYIEYLRGVGDWTKEQELLWAYLWAITETLSQIAESLPNTVPQKHNKMMDKMMGQYKIQPQSNKGIRKGPPPIII